MHAYKVLQGLLCLYLFMVVFDFDQMICLPRTFVFMFISKIVFNLFSWWSAYQGLSFGIQERENRGDDRQEAKTDYIKTPHSISLYFSFL